MKDRPGRYERSMAPYSWGTKSLMRSCQVAGSCRWGAPQWLARIVVSI